MSIIYRYYKQYRYFSHITATRVGGRLDEPEVPITRTSASDAYTQVYPACAAGVPGDLPESRHHAARCAAVGDATHRADCLVLYLVPWCLVWG